MPQSTRDLWPEDIGLSTGVPPVAILREQGEMLAKKTRGLVEGRVNSRPERHARGESGYPFLHEFSITAPAFGDYRYSLLDVRHDFAFYPVAIRFKPADEEFSANSQEEYVRLLAELFSRAETRRVIDALVSQFSD